ncbi:hypothetical protein [Mesorhizobium sp. M7A.F.Ca.CA.002.12.1.1]|uniref:hypothetical protein n=1 Tax=Mesorhizobium sp. M7A.F.Ca.CA.002.12.1.1 TaxID=2496735 RepID=UPI000FCC60A4|nr:hypothetical protein [Mesorhizobium sp. M7A.F.Ca.CA.002.12.1.1]RUX60188.1 hypothetical protein EN989_11280 [Mesorhizobium sp. M7A.F.Ca.CA.002.12.1.1]
MSQTIQLIAMEMALLATTVVTIRKVKKPAFKQCEDCPWSTDIAKRLHKKKVCDRHHQILKELKGLSSVDPLQTLAS